jgi:malate dehydrogenase (oxaloacetate-decarboxylating)(NADP+)
MTDDRTGSVILGGFINAAKMASTASGRDPKDHRIVFLGGGSAAVG